MNFRDKLDAGTQEKIQENWPRVQQIFQEKIGPAALAAAKNDDQMRSVFKMAYEALPFPLRMVVKEDVFVQFCFAHRDNLLPKDGTASQGA
jgi:hypothetical protein